MKTKELSKREKEILELLTTGLTGEQISKALNPPISKRTVDAHMSNMFRKTGVKKSNELIAMYYKEKIAELKS